MIHLLANQRRAGTLAAATLLAMAAAAEASIISVGPSKSGRLTEGTTAVDSTFGSGISYVNFSTNNALVGDNPDNYEFFGLYAYTVTTDFAADFNSGQHVQLNATDGKTNNGTPGSIDLYVLQVSAKTSAPDVANDAVLGGLVTTLTAAEAMVANTYDITTQLTAASGGTLTAGDIIWLGVDPTFTSDGVPDNFSFSSDGGTNVVSTLSTFVVPEPASLALLTLGGLMMSLRRRQR